MGAARRSGPATTPTVKDVAELAGVSPMTVSRTLSGGKNVRAEVQEKVLAAVAELGYHRNENARSIRPGQSSGLIGVAITNLGNPYYGQFALGVEEVAAVHGRRIMLGNTGEQLAREDQLVSDFVGRQVEGLIVVPTGGSARHLGADRLGGIPIVLASRTVDGLAADTVLLDEVTGAYEATKRVLEAGHTRIGFLGNVVSVSTGRRRYEGFLRALAEFGLEPDAELVRRGQQDITAARRAMDELLALDQPPTAVFCANNRNTIGALQAIGSGTRAGGTSASPSQTPTLIGFDDVELADLMQVPLLIVSHDPKELGARAATMLFERLENPELTAAARLVELPVRVGELSGGRD